MIELQDFFSTFWNKSSQEIIDNNISTGNRNSANQDGKIIMLKFISLYKIEKNALNFKRNCTQRYQKIDLFFT